MFWSDYIRNYNKQYDRSRSRNNNTTTTTTTTTIINIIEDEYKS